jgi:hypothetical protein
MIPEIVLNKIYWYLWHYKQINLCIEYHKRVVFHDDESYLIFDDYIYNSRFLRHQNHLWVSSIY